MRVTGQETFDTVVHAWLKAEWSKHGYDKNYPKLQHLIDSPDFNNSEQNNLRLQLLRSSRGNILQQLPADTKWFTAEYEHDDITRTYIIPSDDWLPITSNTFHMPHTLPNVAGDYDHASWIREIYGTLPNPDIDSKIVMVASSLDSNITIIEGNHRATALLKYQEDNPGENLLNQVYIGISDNMIRNAWHIENAWNNPYRPYIKR